MRLMRTVPGEFAGFPYLNLKLLLLLLRLLHPLLLNQSLHLLYLLLVVHQKGKELLLRLVFVDVRGLARSVVARKL